MSIWAPWTAIQFWIRVFADVGMAALPPQSGIGSPSGPTTGRPSDDR